MIKEIFDKDLKAQICKDTLNSLPNWFGIPEAITDYINDCKNMIFYAYYIDNKPIGFMALNPHNIDTIEVHVMGILEEYHRKRIGTDLINQAIDYGKNNQYRILEVKTLDESHPDIYYKRTREFYQIQETMMY